MRFSAIVFDVNETLLDLKALDPAFENHFGPGNFRKGWFDELLKLAFVSTIIGNYSDFGIAGDAALKVLEDRYGKPSKEGQPEDLLPKIANQQPSAAVLSR